MCGRFTLVKTTELSERFDAPNRLPELKPNYNVAPSQTMPAILPGDSNNTIQLMKWGLVPSWSKEPQTRFSTINARAEGLEDSRLYQRPFKSQRCIIPADGFYEWQKTSDKKIPHYIHLKDKQLFGFAGLYDIWHAGQPDELYTFSIITTSANSFMQSIHDRMPVILEKQYEEPWLDQSIDDAALLYSFLKPYDNAKMTAFPVKTDVNNVRNNSPELLTPNT